MTASNMAVVLSPNIFRTSSISEIGTTNEITQLIIENYEEIFEKKELFYSMLPNSKFPINLYRKKFGHQIGISCSCLSKDNNLFISCDRKGEVRIWKSENLNFITKFEISGERPKKIISIENEIFWICDSDKISIFNLVFFFIFYSKFFNSNF